MQKPEYMIGFRYRPPVGGIRIILRDNAGSDGFIHGEVFEHEYYRLPMASPPGTVLDLGANTGLTAIYFGRSYPDAKLACVEPIPGNLQMIARNLELNAIEATIIPAAVDVTDGRLKMELLSKDCEHRVADLSKGALGQTIEVAALSIPSILRRLGWQRIGLLKVDIEGHEKVLFAANCEWLNRVDTMCIECHEGFGETELRRLAEQFGFRPPRRLRGIWMMSRDTNA